jgi:hypothetical protein
MAQNAIPAKGNLAFPVEDDLGLGFNAWQIADQSAATTNPVYSAALSQVEAGAALAGGWRFAATARYVFDFGDDANLGLGAFIGGRAFELRFDLTAGGDLQATMVDESPRVHTVTTGGSGPLAYHHFLLEYDAETLATKFTIDGKVIDAWDGVPTLFTDSVQWGNGVGTTRGIMNYHAVSFEVGPLNARGAGDYDGNHQVDGADFLVWQRSWALDADLKSDGNSDGAVDGGDFSVWRRGFGNANVSGDFDLDGEVNGKDFLAWQRSMGMLERPAADASRDGVVDAMDLSRWRAGLGGPRRPGDYNADSAADGADFLEWQRSFGSSARLSADGNRDGMVSLGDLAIWRTEFGVKGGTTLIPEGDAAALALIFVVASGLATERGARTRGNRG